MNGIANQFFIWFWKQIVPCKRRYLNDGDKIQQDWLRLLVQVKRQRGKGSTKVIYLICPFRFEENPSCVVCNSSAFLSGT